MYGWINSCVKQLVIEKFGQAAWDAILEKVSYSPSAVKPIRHEHYPDNETYDLVTACTEVLGVGADTVLEVFGQYFLHFVQEHGYENMLRAQGSSLRYNNIFFTYSSYCNYKFETQTTENGSTILTIYIDTCKLFYQF